MLYRGIGMGIPEETGGELADAMSPSSPPLPPSQPHPERDRSPSPRPTSSRSPSPHLLSPSAAAAPNQNSSQKKTHLTVDTR